MNITVVYQLATAKDQVFLHAWDQNGLVCHVSGARSDDGRSFQFTINGATQDQRDVSFKYQYPGESQEWERDDFIRTVPTLSATKLWTYDFSARCLTTEPGTTAAFSTVTVHAHTQQRYRHGRLFVWVPGTAGFTVDESQRDDATATSTFVVSLDDRLHAGFHFKLIGAGSPNDLKDFEPDYSNRVWRPGDGPEVWIKSGQVDLRTKPIALRSVPIDFIYPPELGTPHLHIEDLVDDYNATLDPAVPAVIDEHLSRTRYTVSVYPGAIYNLSWSTEPCEMARRFRIPLDGSGGPSLAVNGYDHWLSQLPASASGQLKLVIHPNPASAFGQGIEIKAGIGTASAHQTETSTRQPDGTWIAEFNTLPGVPCWLTLQGEYRPDGPLDFRRVFVTNSQVPTTLHTIDGVGGVSVNAPLPFHDVPAERRRALMESAYGQEAVAARVFDGWEMPHGTSAFDGQAYFTVRAPHALAVSLLLLNAPDASPRQVQEVPMELTHDLRYWWCAVPQAQAAHGTYYRFAYRDGRELLAPQLGEVLDPASRWASDRGRLVVDAGTGSTQSWSRLIDRDRLQQAFIGSSWRTPGWDDLLIYEMHARRFTQRNPPMGASPSDFDQVAAELNGGYLARLPVSALEFLPVHEFPGSQSWGYNPTLFFAIDSDYGGPEPFARLVRASHDAGRAVLLDVVFNHMMESPLQALARSVYVSGETAWGDMVHYAHPAAVEFFRQALVYLWSNFHLDGFRFDSTETIVNGHRADTSSAPYILARGPDGNLRTGAGKGWEFLGALRRALRMAADAVGQPWPYLVGENDPENAGMTDPQNGVLDGQWHFREMYALGDAAYDTDDKAGDVRGSIESIDQPFWRAVPYAESHDTARGEDKQQRIARREAWGYGRQMAKVVGTVTLLSKGVPMLFMGEEAAEDRPFALNMLASDPAFVLRLDEYEQPGSESANVLTWFRHLMGLRRNPDNGLRGDGWQALGSGRKTVAFSRAEGRYFVIATFGTPDTQQDLGWLNLPAGSAYKEIFNSSWPQYQVHAEPNVDNGGYAAALRAGNLIRLPSIGAVVLERL
jgi:1,4-alpha-glucan branching enzyme